MTEQEKEFSKEFGTNLKALIKESGETVKSIADESWISKMTLQRYFNNDAIPSLASINNLIMGTGWDYDDIITMSSPMPVDWTRGGSMVENVTEDDLVRISMLQKRVRFGVEGIPTNMYVANTSVNDGYDCIISKADYRKALSEGLNRLLTTPDGEGGREFIETIDILSKALMIPKRDLYRYLDGTRTIGALHAYNIINFFGMRPQCLLGNFSCYVVEDYIYD